MSVRKLTANLLTLLVMLTAAATIARAQDPHKYFPPADPLAFDPDFQWFEPVYDLDLADMKAKQRASTGWYATYDRLLLYGSRPDLNEPDITRTRIDRGWGHRYQIGYMIPHEDHGFQFVWTNHSVGKSFVRIREKQNRYNGDQVVGGQGGGYPTEPGLGFFVPQEEFNNFGYNNRFITNWKNCDRSPPKADRRNRNSDRFRRNTKTAREDLFAEPFVFALLRFAKPVRIR